MSAYDLDYLMDLISQAIDLRRNGTGFRRPGESQALIHNELKPAIELEVQLRLKEAINAETLNEHLLNFIILFQATAKQIIAQGSYRESLLRKRGNASFRCTDTYGQLRSWYQSVPREEFEILGLIKNEQTFENLYRLTVFHGIPEEWMNTPAPDLGKFDVYL